MKTKKQIKKKSQPLSETARQRIIKELKRGLTVDAACGCARVSVSRFNAQMEACIKFAKEVELAMLRSRAIIEAMVLDKIEEGDAKMALDYLKRRYPADWAGRVQHETKSADSKDEDRESDDTIVRITLGPDPYYRGS